MRTEDRVIPDLLCGRDEHLVRDTEAPELRGRQGAAATHRAASVAYAVTGAALTRWPGGRPPRRRRHDRQHRHSALTWGLPGNDMMAETEPGLSVSETCRFPGPSRRD